MTLRIKVDHLSLGNTKRLLRNRALMTVYTILGDFVERLADEHFHVTTVDGKIYCPRKEKYTLWLEVDEE